MSPQDLLTFWFSPRVQRFWFRSTAEFDAEVRRDFLALWRQAVAGELAAWQQDVEGALALVILLDQLPLHMFRNQAEGYSSETQARTVAEAAIAQGFDVELKDEVKHFLYLPFMHSESLADQERSVALFEQAGLTGYLRWARHHREIVRRFGRFPHRNRALDRASSPEELAWLASPEGFTP